MTRLLPANWIEYELASIAQLAPIQWLEWPLMDRLQLKVGVKREDLLHPQLGGNKLYKLYHHLKAAKCAGVDHVVSFGGAWSNHIYALAAAGESLGLRTTGIIRGERPASLSATLADASAMGMSLHFISRQAYREKRDPVFLQQLKQEFGPCYIVPEGGGDLLGAQGCADLGRGLGELRSTYPFDVVCCAVGTGSTLAGIASGLPSDTSVYGFSVLKGEGDLRQEIDGFERALGRGANCTLEAAFHCGGYARFPAELREFVVDFEEQTGVLLDPVYTAKMMWGIACKARAGHWAASTRILALHSGGLQGRRGFETKVSAGT
jgi:1-aminocyclopropane-1-carboxylate deaminase